MLPKYSERLSRSAVAAAGAVSLHRHQDLQCVINHLEGCEDDIVYILNVVEVEQLLQSGELFLRNVIISAQNFIRSVLCLSFGLEGQDRKHDGIRVEQETEASENQRPGAVIGRIKDIFLIKLSKVLWTPSLSNNSK